MDFTIEKFMTTIQSSCDLGKIENKIIFKPLNESIKLSKYLNYLQQDLVRTHQDNQKNIQTRLSEKIKNINNF